MLSPGALTVIEHVPMLKRFIADPVTVQIEGEFETTLGAIRNPRNTDFELSERYGTHGRPILPQVASEYLACHPPI